MIRWKFYNMSSHCLVQIGVFPFQNFDVTSKEEGQRDKLLLIHSKLYTRLLKQEEIKIWNLNNNYKSSESSTYFLRIHMC